MASEIISRRMARVFDTIGPVIRFFNESSWARRYGDPDVSDFAFGNPQEMPLPGFVETLGKWSVPQNKDWYAYKGNEPAAQAGGDQGLPGRFAGLVGVPIFVLRDAPLAKGLDKARQRHLLRVAEGKVAHVWIAGSSRPGRLVEKTKYRPDGVEDACHATRDYF